MDEEQIRTVHLGLCHKGEGIEALIKVFSLPDNNAFVKGRADCLTNGRDFFYKLGKKAAGYGYVCNSSELIYVHPLKTTDFEPIYDLDDLESFAKAIAEFHSFKKGVKVGEEIDLTTASQ